MQPSKNHLGEMEWSVLGGVAHKGLAFRNKSILCKLLVRPTSGEDGRMVPAAVSGCHQSVAPRAFSAAVVCAAVIPRRNSASYEFQRLRHSDNFPLFLTFPTIFV